MNRYTRRATLFHSAVPISEMAAGTLGRAITLGPRDVVTVPIPTLAADPARGRSDGLVGEAVETREQGSGDEHLGGDAAFLKETAAAHLVEAATLAGFFDAGDSDTLCMLLVSGVVLGVIGVLRWPRKRRGNLHAVRTLCVVHGGHGGHGGFVEGFDKIKMNYTRNWRWSLCDELV